MVDPSGHLVGLVATRSRAGISRRRLPARDLTPEIVGKLLALFSRCDNDPVNSVAAVRRKNATSAAGRNMHTIVIDNAQR